MFGQVSERFHGGHEMREVNGKKSDRFQKALTEKDAAKTIVAELWQLRLLINKPMEIYPPL